jgi:hypothetical protein
MITITHVARVYAEKATYYSQATEYVDLGIVSSDNFSSELLSPFEVALRN